MLYEAIATQLWTISKTHHTYTYWAYFVTALLRARRRERRLFSEIHQKLPCHSSLRNVILFVFLGYMQTMPPQYRRAR